MTIAAGFRSDIEATLLGEPTGARPDGFRENHVFTLPDSTLPASVTTRACRFDPRDPETVFADACAEPDRRLVRIGQDAASGWLLAQPER